MRECRRGSGGALPSEPRLFNPNIQRPRMRKPSAGQWFEFLVWTGFAVAAYALSFGFDRGVEMYRYGAAGWPRAVVLIILLAAAGQLLHDLRGGGAATAAVDYFSRMATEHGQRYVVRMGITLALPVLYASLLDHSGYYFTTPFFLAGYLYVTGERRVKWLIGMPLVIYAVLTVLFTRYLYVGLPVGYWPGFYDFGNWLVVLIRR